MRHTRLGALPRTRAWGDVVSLIAGGAGAAQIANASTVVSAESVPDDSSRKPPKALRFEVGQTMDVLDESHRYWLAGADFVRTPDGRAGLPYRGGAPFVGYVDLAKKSFVPYKEAFPPTGEKPYKGGPTRYGWVAMLDEGPKPQGLWLFVSRWNREARRWASWRARILFEAPDRIEPADMKGVAVLEILARSGKEFIACIDDGPDRTWARISNDTWRRARRRTLKLSPEKGPPS